MLQKDAMLTIEGYSLFILGPKNKLRLLLASFVQNPMFDQFIFRLIGLNSLLLAIAEPSMTDNYSIETIKLMNMSISILFVAECGLKILVMGFTFGKHTYLKDPFNMLDFIIVVFSISDFLLNYYQAEIDVSAIRAFRALRALRPLKLVSKNEGMKLVVNSLLSSLKNLFNVMLISFLFYYVFGILGL